MRLNVKGGLNQALSFDHKILRCLCDFNSCCLSDNKAKSNKEGHHKTDRMTDRMKPQWMLETFKLKTLNVLWWKSLSLCQKQPVKFSHVGYYDLHRSYVAIRSFCDRNQAFNSKKWREGIERMLSFTKELPSLSWEECYVPRKCHVDCIVPWTSIWRHQSWCAPQIFWNCFKTVLHSSQTQWRQGSKLHYLSLPSPPERTIRRLISVWLKRFDIGVNPLFKWDNRYPVGQSISIGYYPD